MTNDVRKSLTPLATGFTSVKNHVFRYGIERP